jgi:hypothetical protein
MLENSDTNFISTNINYNFESQKKICVVMSFFNPANYNSNIFNANTVLKNLLDSNIPVFLTELLYNNQQSELIYKTNTVYADSVIFSKENLWNITEVTVPKEYNKIIFMDSDINYSDSDWLIKSYDLLDTYSVIQPMENCVGYLPNMSLIDINNYNTKKSVAYSIQNKKYKNLSYHQFNQRYHPGYCIGIKRHTFKQMGGFFEHAIIGGGDRCFWESFVDLPQIDYYKSRIDIKNKYAIYKKNISSIINETDVSYIENNTALHMYHGDRKDRQYDSRTSYISNNSDNFYYNKYGVLEVINEPNIMNYFKSRNEDG